MNLMHWHHAAYAALGVCFVLGGSACAGRERMNPKVADTKDPETTSATVGHATPKSPQPVKDLSSDTPALAPASVSPTPAPGARVEAPMSGPMYAGSANPTETASAELSDGQIAALADEATTTELEHGRYAAEHATAANVKSFAQRMLERSDAFHQKIMDASRNQNIAPTASPRSNRMSAEARAQLESWKSQTGGDFDRAYMDVEQKTLKDDLNLFDNKLIANVKSTQLRASLRDVRAKLAQSLSEAQAIRTSLGGR